MTPRVFFYVQHLLGIGHLRRAAVLARALAAGGFDVLLVSGGAPVPLDTGRARRHQLPLHRLANSSPERESGPQRELFQGIDGSLANPAGRSVDHPQQRNRIIGIVDDLQIGDQVLDLGALVK